jgi:hypothetical protein
MVTSMAAVGISAAGTAAAVADCTLGEAEALLVGIRPEPSSGQATATTDIERLERARSVFHDMQREYAAGNFVRYGELLGQLEKILAVPLTQ